MAAYEAETNNAFWGFFPLGTQSPLSNLSSGGWSAAIQ